MNEISAKRFNILHIVNIYFTLPFFIGDQFLFFNTKGYNLHVICSPSEYLKSYSEKMNFCYKEVQISRSFSILKDIKAIVLICRYIRSNQINIVVGHTPKGALLSMISAYFMRVPKRIYFRHGLVYETSKGFKRRLLVNLDRITSFCATDIVCVSPSVFKKSLEDKLNCITKQVILGKGTCTGIDTSKTFSPSNIDFSKINQLRTKLGILDDMFVVGFCGRLVRDKGIIELVNAFHLVKMNYPQSRITLLLIGMFEERDSLPNEVINKIKRDKDIIYTGFINDSIQYYYALMNIFVLASYREGFPTSVLEASAMEIPVLTTKATGCIDSIVENVTGKFIETDAKSIAQGIEFYINNALHAKMHGQNGRDFVKKNFDQKIIWHEIVNLYER